MLKYYFETLFDNNMNWNNQSIYWQIDHRIPISWFNLENDEELKFACNYKNLQPMEKSSNLNKSHDYPNNHLFNYAFHSEDTSCKYSSIILSCVFIIIFVLFQYGEKYLIIE